MNNNYFETTDLDLAAAIGAAIGASVLAIHRTTSGRAVYVFDRNEVIDEFVQAVSRGDIRVEPVVFSLIRRSIERRASASVGEDSPNGLAM